jgi:3-oxosteroid 1-dehydrogenase
MSEGWDHAADVVIVGGGAAGLGAALTAKATGLEPLVLEGHELLGGSTNASGGGMWVPGNRFSKAAGQDDSPEKVLDYMEELVGDLPPASTRARKEAFVYNVPRAFEFLESQGLEFRWARDYPDYYPHRRGGSDGGRGIDPELFDRKKLGELEKRYPPIMWPYTLAWGAADLAAMVMGKRSLKGAATVARLYARRAVSRLRGQKLVGGGAALSAQLLYQVLQRGIPFWVDTRVVELVEENGRVTGVVAEQDGNRLRIEGRRAVFLGAGGFARNDEMRQRYQRHPITNVWTSSPMSDQGDGIKLGMSVGAVTALMDEAWWGPSSMLPTESGPVAIFHVHERSKPGSLIVDQTAQRYFDEAMDYVGAGQAMYERDKDAPAIPSWLIFDQRFRSRYPFGAFIRTPQPLVECGYLKRAGSIEELARLCDLDSGALKQSIERFNGFARKGVDEDFHRGENAYDRYFGDPRVKPNPCLGLIDKPPFYAVALYPGDLGTKGGLVTDENARVLRADGTTIDGLYASGNTSASVMGRQYPGPGVTLAPALTFAWLAMRHVAGVPTPAQPEAEASAVPVNA